MRPKRSASMQRWRVANREYVNARAVEQRKARWVVLNAYKIERGCVQCGERRGPCLEFHHKDPTTKEGNISIMLVKWSVKRLLVEAEKCDVICANCHRMLHASESGRA
jgi:hypothetical protein